MLHVVASMTVKLLTEHHFGFRSLKEAAQVHLSQHLSKCRIVGNNMSRLIYTCMNQPRLTIHCIKSLAYKGLNLSYTYFSANDPLNGAKGAYVKNCYVSDSATGTKYYTVDEFG